jgi:hypothetical protein
MGCPFSWSTPWTFNKPTAFWRKACAEPPRPSKAMSMAQENSLKLHSNVFLIVLVCDRPIASLREAPFPVSNRLPVEGEKPYTVV